MNKSNNKNSDSRKGQPYPNHNTKLNNLASGEFVIDRKHSHLSSDTATRAAVNEALSRIHGNNRQFIEEEITYDKPVGQTVCVSTTDNDIIVMAKRRNRTGLSRLVMNRTPEPSSKVFVVLKKSGPFEYVLITGFIGGKPHPELFDTNAFDRKEDPAKAYAEAKEFWSNHALIYHSQEIEP
ncbi:MAG: hypothetical protein ACOYM3_16400 [Terrimicrobiaceae bacterium]